MYFPFDVNNLFFFKLIFMPFLAEMYFPIKIQYTTLEVLKTSTLSMKPGKQKSLREIQYVVK